MFETKNPPKGSRILNFMLNSHPLITNDLTWDIILRHDALFLEESWDGLPSPDSANLLINIQNILSSPWSKNVSDYKIKTNNNKYRG